MNWKEIIVCDKYIIDLVELSKFFFFCEDVWNFIIEDLKCVISLFVICDVDNVGCVISGFVYVYFGFVYLICVYEEVINKDFYLVSVIEVFN